MKLMMRKVPLFLIGLAVFVLAISIPLSWADEHDEIPFDVARLFFQLNDTDGDLGIHLMVDGEPWKTLEIDDPKDRRYFYVRTQSRLRRQGLTEFKFESAEPNFEEFSAEAFLRRFREGEYDIEGKGLDGTEYESTVVISHVIPAAPDNLAVNGEVTPDDCDEGPVPGVSAPFTLSWDPVVSSHAEIGKAGPIEIVRYEVAVEREEPTFLKLEANIHVPEGGPAATTFELPSAVLSLGDEVKFQILVQDAGGNETSAESCFEVE